MMTSSAAIAPIAISAFVRGLHFNPVLPMFEHNSAQLPLREATHQAWER